MGKDIIYTVKSATFTIDGEEWPINSVDMVLAINAIPYAIVNMPPHFYDKKGYSIQNPDLQDVQTGLDYLYKMADKDAVCNLELTLQQTGGDDNTVSIKCKNWILSDVSASSVSTVSGFLVSCKIQHPAYNLLRHGYFAGSLDTALDFAEIGVDVDDIVDAADTVIDELTDAELREISGLDPDVPHAAGYDEIQETLEKMVENVALKAKPSMYLEMLPQVNKETYNKKPIKSLVEEYSDLFDTECLDIAMCSSVVPSENVSVWDAILDAGALWGYSILPTYLDEKLKVFPITPWGKPLYTVDEKRIYSINLPAYDANPILGVKCSNAVSGDEATASSFAVDKNIEDETQSEVVYMPTGNLDKLHGRILGISSPPWLSVLQAAASSMRECNLTGNCTKDENVVAGSDDDLIDMVYEAQVKFACYVFQLTFKQSYAANINMPLTTHIGSVVFYPGASMRVASEGGGVIDGYITTINHHISIDTSSGTTSVALSYCRPPGGYEDIVEEGDLNPLYTKYDDNDIDGSAFSKK